MPNTPQALKESSLSNLKLTEDEDDFDEDLDEGLIQKRPRKESHPDQADRVVPPSQVKKRPGRIYTRGEITLHTNMGHRMFYGRRPDRKKNVKEIVGLVRFIRNMNQICDLAKVGDPYADYWLLEIEQLLSQSKEALMDIKQYLLDLLQAGGTSSRISIKSGISESPVTLPLEFKYRQYGFLAAELVGLFDEVVQLGLNAKDAAWLTRSEFKQFIGSAGRTVRRCFFTSRQYKFSGAMRNDFAANNERARSALERMGFELPDDILSGYRQPKWMAPHEVVLPTDAGPESDDDKQQETGSDQGFDIFASKATVKTQVSDKQAEDVAKEESGES